MPSRDFILVQFPPSTPSLLSLAIPPRPHSFGIPSRATFHGSVALTGCCSSAHIRPETGLAPHLQRAGIRLINIHPPKSNQTSPHTHTHRHTHGRRHLLRAKEKVGNASEKGYILHLTYPRDPQRQCGEVRGGRFLMT